MTKALTPDVLTSILRTLRLRVRLMSRGDYCGQWALDSGARNKATFHLVGRGELWLHCKLLDEPMLLRQDDLLFFPRPQWHQFSCTPRKRNGTHLGDAPGPGKDVTTVICCVVEFETGAHDLVLRSLPDVSIVHCTQGRASSELVALARLMLTEHDAETSGFEAVLERLAEALFIEILRHYMRDESNLHGVLRALADPQLSRALSVMHEHPQRDWDVEALALVANMSRSTFARHFSRCLETSPMQYLAAWRMHLAEDLLRDSRRSAAQVAEAVGYENETAFRRAFSRIRGVGPGAIRRVRGAS
ncbi:MAG TPA: AraC family transcriptional regulator [Nevskiaceae bacterium]|nr:AraC family transcriptional regulator [Nevskiaceae bacterium]